MQTSQEGERRRQLKLPIRITITTVFAVFTAASI
jgi:hypothetical protein